MCLDIWRLNGALRKCDAAVLAACQAERKSRQELCEAEMAWYGSRGLSAQAWQCARSDCKA
eukprot:7082614-Karenia_brevis.AAC.1